MGKRRKTKSKQSLAADSSSGVFVEETKMQIEGANGVKLDVVIEQTHNPFSQDGQSTFNSEDFRDLFQSEEFKKGNFDSMAQLGAHMGAISA